MSNENSPCITTSPSIDDLWKEACSGKRIFISGSIGNQTIETEVIPIMYIYNTSFSEYVRRYSGPAFRTVSKLPWQGNLIYAIIYWDRSDDNGNVWRILADNGENIYYKADLSDISAMKNYVNKLLEQLS